MKNIFLFRFHSPMLINVARLLRKSGIRIVYWEGSKKYFEHMRESSEFTDTIFHDTMRAVRGLPAPEIDDESFSPPGEALLKRLLSAESEVLAMMTAVDYGNTPLLRKKHIYYEYVKYWCGLLEMLKPDAIVFGDVPHIAHQYTLYAIAKHFGIKTITFRTIPVMGRLIFFTDHTTYTELAEILHETATLPAPEIMSLLSPDVREYYKRQTDMKDDAHPFYTQKPYRNEFTKTARFLRSPRVIYKHIRNRTLLSVARRYFNMLFIKRRIASLQGITLTNFALKRKMAEWQKIKQSYRREYAELVEPIDWGVNFVYVALHKQPEASTSAMGGIFTDQILMVDILSRALPEGWMLYVKESVLQWENPRGELGRYPGYYRDMKKRSNIKFIDAGIDTFKLTRHAQAVATVTGTVGWEALLRGKPAFVFGYIWYMHCHGALRISDVESARAAFEQIQSGFVPDQDEVRRFLLALDRATIKGFPNLRFQKDAGVSTVENISNITAEILKFLKIA